MKDHCTPGSKPVKRTPSTESKRRSEAKGDPDQEETNPGYYTLDGSFITLPARPRTTPKRNTR